MVGAQAGQPTVFTVAGGRAERRLSAEGAEFYFTGLDGRQWLVYKVVSSRSGAPNVVPIQATELGISNELAVREVYRLAKDWSNQVEVATAKRPPLAQVGNVWLWLLAGWALVIGFVLVIAYRT